MSVTLVLAGDTAETVDESLRLFGVNGCLCFLCFERVYISGRVFCQAVSVRGSVFFSDRLFVCDL